MAKGFGDMMRQAKILQDKIAIDYDASDVDEPGQKK